MKNCIFCQIVAGKVPCHKVYEDKDFLGFLDAKPRNPGHSLLIPKKHYRWVDDIPNFGDFFEVAKKVGVAIKEVFSPRLVSYKTWGLDVLHAHVHIVPFGLGKEKLTAMSIKNPKKIPEEKMRKIAESIRKRVKI